ncbi:MAG: cobalt transporter CbiM [Desulfobacteraceae bacterium]|jgi:cobalt/nickel transport system permease protein
MHISEGVLKPEILAGTAVLTVCFVAAGLRRIEDKEIPAMGILSAAFFVASLVHVPAGPVSVHLVLNGLLGILLGLRAFPSILIALFLQALMFQFGGFTSLGANTLNMALPAVICYLALGWVRKPETGQTTVAVAGFLCGFFSVLMSGLMVGITLALNGEAFFTAAKVVVIAHLPVMVIEGVLTSSCLVFIKKVKPEMLAG